MTSRGITWAFTAEQQVTGQAACSCINITANCLFVTLGSPPGLRPLGLAHSPAGESPARRHRVCLFSALPGAGLHPGPLAGLMVLQPAHGVGDAKGAVWLPCQPGPRRGLLVPQPCLRPHEGAWTRHWWVSCFCSAQEPGLGQSSQGEWVTNSFLCLP